MTSKKTVGNGPVKFAASLIAALLIFHASASEAQQMPVETQAPAAMKTNKPAPAGNDPEQSENAPTDQDQSQARVRKFDDWYYRCVDVKSEDGAATEACEVVQVITVKQADEDVGMLTLAIAKAPTVAPSAKASQRPGDLMLTALVPLNIFLPAGLGIDADNKSVVDLVYRNCNQAGCWSQQKLDARMLAALQRGATGQGAMQLTDGQKVNVNFSLKGLKAALSELQKSTAGR